MRRCILASSLLCALLLVAHLVSAEPIVLRADRMLDVESGRILSTAGEIYLEPSN